jgi:3-deoxy-7-phosphoheptulonate synthase
MHASSKVHIDDVRIKDIKELAPPIHMLREFPPPPRRRRRLSRRARAIHRILFGRRPPAGGDRPLFHP